MHSLRIVFNLAVKNVCHSLRYLKLDAHNSIYCKHATCHVAVFFEIVAFIVLSFLPCYVAGFNEKSMKNIVEIARNIKKLSNHGLSHKEIGQYLGMKETSVTHHLRILNLTPGVLKMLEQGEISFGHGKALASQSKDVQMELARLANRQRLSVRQLEKKIQTLKSSEKNNFDGKLLPECEQLQNGLMMFLQAPVKLNFHDGKGLITIQFASLDILDGLLERIGYIKTEADW